MCRKYILFLITILWAFSCSVPQRSTSLLYKDYPVNKDGPADSSLSKMLQPYASSLNTTMNKVIGFSNNNLTVKQPESEIGNFMADCMQVMAEKKFGRKVDAGFVNKGGIRSYIPKGNITVGKVFELMPFDNLIVLQEVKGSVLQAFLDKTASLGGWPVSSGVRMGIKDKKAINIRIGGKPLDLNQVYVIANSDYVANGGDDCDMLRNLPKINKGILLRDAIMEYVTNLTEQGKPVDSPIENRVVNVN